MPRSSWCCLHCKRWISASICPSRSMACLRQRCASDRHRSRSAISLASRSAPMPISLACSSTSSSFSCRSRMVLACAETSFSSNNLASSRSHSNRRAKSAWTTGVLPPAPVNVSAGYWLESVSGVSLIRKLPPCRTLGDAATMN